MVDDRDKAIRDYIPQAINLGIVRPEVQVDKFESKLVMFQDALNSRAIQWTAIKRSSSTP